MSDEEFFKAEKVFIKECVEGGAGNMIQTGTKLQPSPDHVSLSQTKASPSVDARSQNTSNHVTAGTASMETAVDKHRDISRRPCPDASRHAEVSSGFFANRLSEDRASPTDSGDMFPTPASSRESILSERSWSAAQVSSVTSPVSFSRTVSPCSSVLSGVFSPAVVQIKRHFLAPGSSLIHLPQTCFSSCESLSSSVCPQSPPPRHRPPLTRLSLLTAILRKGRLPVLSAALQRPYTPCWPVNPVTLSFCNACSAASSVASIPLELSSQFSSSASIDRCLERIRSSSAPRWEQVISPPTLPRAPPSLFCTNFKSVAPPKHDEIDCAASEKPHHVSNSKSPEPRPSSARTHVEGGADNHLKKLITPSSKFIKEQETSEPRNWSQNSTLSKLHSLSQKLRSSPLCSPQHQPSCTPSPLPPSHSSTARCESKDAATSQPLYNAHCLSPSRYTPMVFPGWLSPGGSPTPTPSPAPPIRDLTPSPSLSLHSTPSPRPGSGISDCSDREGKKRKVAATANMNMCFLQMCSPAQLRQQSEELYAVIDEILANSIPEVSSISRQNTSSSPKSLGRETKYVSKITWMNSPLLSTIQTKPGVIRPMTAIPRLTVDDEEEFHPNPFRQFNDKRTFTDNSKVT
uniref:Muscular LMNA interacting protein n=1 Tax=Sparus aurata TaxID=8175 RepID=A0A671YUU2_SPAAU